ncbi:hypothetical protein [Nocardiopsis ganjiahuensis]|uniref:hypothetical protein n=1 Tax=Nocardiopsis ganjiahuensis TaxID=239984 RepID=UPI000347DA4F|nr:hypothetical protein [Nocardiopsis ganjiahuensis]
MLIGWRRSGGWSRFGHVGEGFGHVDPEDALWWLLNRGARLGSIRPALAAACPDFDPDTEIDRVTMPDRTEQRAKDKQRRLAARAEFERARHRR